METQTKVLLLGGTSHSGKSTLGARLAAELGWDHLSTDRLARHPGRPWRDDDSLLPSDVTDHYTSHSPSQLLERVLEHYRANVWPIVDAVVRSRLANPFDASLVLEGSAILPERVRQSEFAASCTAVWLTPDEQIVEGRILESSRFRARAPRERERIEAFLQRSLLFNAFIRRTAGDLGFGCLDSGSGDPLASLRALVTPGQGAGKA